jgi:hypothetical protein
MFGAGPEGFAAQTRQFAAGRPIGGLLHGPVAAHPLPLGFALATGELAVGLLVLAGLATRLAAAGLDEREVRAKPSHCSLENSRGGDRYRSLPL